MGLAYHAFSPLRRHADQAQARGANHFVLLCRPSSLPSGHVGGGQRGQNVDRNDIKVPGFLLEELAGLAESNDI